MMVHVLPDESKFGHLGESFASLTTSVSVDSGRGEQMAGDGGMYGMTDPYLAERKHGLRWQVAADVD